MTDAVDRWLRSPKDEGVAKPAMRDFEAAAVDGLRTSIGVMEGNDD